MNRKIDPNDEHTCENKVEDRFASCPKTDDAATRKWFFYRLPPLPENNPSTFVTNSILFPTANPWKEGRKKKEFFGLG